ncbi:MAG: sigma-70 family RNA polymerase sigma factor [Clostridia bacterium]|nr:sigma-70 family RNA polymerase sigma factor [Clostridia bacterium]
MEQVKDTVPEHEPTIVNRAQAGDAGAREELIQESRDFILNVASRQVKRAVGPSDDEFSIALLAFNEAVDKYDPARSAAFRTFATEVIRRRLIDHYRGKGRWLPEVPWSALPEGTDFASADEDERRNVRYEIEAFVSRLSEFGITLEELVRVTPKHRDTREITFSIAARIAGDAALRGQFLQKKAIPLKTLFSQILFSPKTVQRHRKYIIAACIVLTGDFPIIREYLARPERGMAPDEQ